MQSFLGEIASKGALVSREFRTDQAIVWETSVSIKWPNKAVE